MAVIHTIQKYLKAFLVLIIISVFIIFLSNLNFYDVNDCTNIAPTIYVNNKYYFIAGHITIDGYKKIESNLFELGEVTLELTGTELPTNNFEANKIPVNTKLMYDEDRDLLYIRYVQSYVEKTGDDGYMIFEPREI